MATISISNLPTTGSDLLMDSESFLTDLTDNEFSEVLGGYIDGDWCGTTKITRPTLTITITRTTTITSFPPSIVVGAPVLA